MESREYKYKRLDQADPTEGDVATAARNSTQKTVPSEEEYGWGKWTPAALQCFNNPRWFLFFVSVSVVAQSMCVNGLIGVTISTLEKRFDFSSTQASMIPSVYDFASAPVILLVGFFGSGCHRPRWIGVGMLLVGLGSIIYALPHFTTGVYEYENAAFDNLCHLDANTTSPCGDTAPSGGAHQHYLFLFIFTTLLFAVGSQPLYIFAVTYLDDSLSRHASAVYFGVFYSMGSIGPAIAYIGGGYLLEYYTDIDKLSADQIKLDSSDPRWVGAWWIGFLVTCALALFPVIPLLGYPAHMDYDDNREYKGLETYSSGNDEDDLVLHSYTFPKSCSHLCKILKVLFLNPTFMMVTLASVSDAMLINGFTNFGPKYLENQFSVSPSVSGMIFGVIVVPGAAGGSLVGSYLVKRLALDCGKCARATFVMSALVMSLIAVFLVRCDNARFHGVNVAGTQLVPCDLTCVACAETAAYSPVCGDNGVTYFSPCYAGCTHVTLHDKGDKIYTNCSCTSDTASSSNVSSSPVSSSFSATEGICPVESCVLLPLFCIGLFLQMFFLFIEGIFKMQVIIRSVVLTQRALALSIQSVIARLAGSIPGAIVFGAILDHSCSLWETRCSTDADSTSDGSCLYYDNNSMANSMIVLATVVKAISTVFCFMAWKLYKSKAGTDPTDSDSSLALKDIITNIE